MTSNPSRGRVSQVFDAETTPLSVRYNYEAARPRLVSPQKVSNLINENLEFYGRIKNLEQLLQSEQEGKEKLHDKVQKLESTIQRYNDRASNTKEDELEMAAEILKLKRQLAKERQTNQKIYREIQNEDIENELGRPSRAEVREKELIQRVKDARKSAEQNHKDAEMTAVKLQNVEDEKERLVADLENLRNQIKELRTMAGEGEMVKGINEGLKIQLEEAWKTADRQSVVLEQLRKENFELNKCPPPIFLEPESDKENLGRALQLQLRRRVDRLESEKEELRKKLVVVEGRCMEAVNHERAMEENTKKLEDALHQVIVKKFEVEKLAVDNRTLASQLEIAKDTLATETLKWMQRIEELDRRADDAEEQRNAAEECLKCQGSSKNEIIEQLYKSKALTEELESENRQLRVQIDTLHGKVEEEKQRGIQLRDEVEDKLKPEIAQLQQQLEAAKSANERLKGDFELKEYLLKEEQCVAQQTKAQLDRAQQRLEESETHLTQQSHLTSDQAERLVKSEALRRQKDADIHDLNNKNSSLKSLVNELKSQLHDAKTENNRLADLYENLECRYTLAADEHRRVLSDVAFYRQELERFAGYSQMNSSTAANGKEREERLRMLLDGLKRQIMSAKEELKTLDTDVNEQIKKLPLALSGASEEFEIVHIVQHFQGEKREVENQLRSMTLRLTEAECSHQSLLETHQALKQSHARTLKDLLDLKQSKQTLLPLKTNPLTMTDSSANQPENRNHQLQPPNTTVSTADAALKRVTTASVQIQSQIMTSTAEEDKKKPSKTLLPNSSSTTENSEDVGEYGAVPEEYLVAQESLVRQVLRSSSPHLLSSVQSTDESSVRTVMSQHGSNVSTPTTGFRGGAQEPKLPPTNEQTRLLNDRTGEASDTAAVSASTVKQRIALFDKRRLSDDSASFGPSLPRSSCSDSPRVTSCDLFPKESGVAKSDVQQQAQSRSTHNSNSTIQPPRGSSAPALQPPSKLAKHLGYLTKQSSSSCSQENDRGSKTTTTLSGAGSAPICSSSSGRSVEHNNTTTKEGPKNVELKNGEPKTGIDEDPTAESLLAARASRRAPKVRNGKRKVIESHFF